MTIGAMCDHPACTKRSTHYIAGRLAHQVDIHACDEHLAALRPLVPHAGEAMSPTKRALLDVLETVVYMRLSLDASLVAENAALAVLDVLTAQPNTRELLLRYLEEIAT